MGSFAVLRISKFTLHEEKNHLYLNHSCLFTPHELQEICFTDDIEENESKKVYSASLQKVSSRLELLGFSLERCKIKLENNLNEYKSKYHKNKIDLTIDDLLNTIDNIDVDYSLYDFAMENLSISIYSDLGTWYLYLKYKQKGITSVLTNTDSEIKTWYTRLYERTTTELKSGRPGPDGTTLKCRSNQVEIRCQDAGRIAPSAGQKRP